MATSIKLQQCEQYEYFAPCARGVEQVLARELTLLGAKRVRPLQAGVAFFGLLETGYRACLWLRTASRVLLILDRLGAADAEELYGSIKALPWERHIDPSRTIAVSAQGTNTKLNDTRFIAQKVKDALCDRLRELTGKRPSVARERPDVKLSVSMHATRATIALDLAGDPLHMRNYRVPSSAIVAPLRESQAAFLCRAAGWDCPWSADSDSPAVLLDPLCGSGTIAIEAALIALDRAPGRLRSYWGFTGWLGHDSTLWRALLQEADVRTELVLQNIMESRNTPIIFASDIDPAAVEVARNSASLAGVQQIIEFSVADISEVCRSEKDSSEKTGKGTGKVSSEKTVKDSRGNNSAGDDEHCLKDSSPLRRLIVTNPPYGQRLSSTSQLPALYAALRTLIDPSLIKHPDELCVITSDEDLEAYLGQTPVWQIETFNGPTEVTISYYSSQKHNDPDTLSPTTVIDQRDVEQFENRLRKMAQHRAKWARRTGVSCYRVYDADLPSFSVAIDLYEGAGSDEGTRWLHIAEYAPPNHIDQALAAQRLTVVLSSAPPILAVPLSHVYLKTRRRAKGGSQYAQKESATGSQHMKKSDETITESPSVCICENDLLFEIDLASHLDTGIFLDHRLTRVKLRELACGKDTLNLFAYTGTASVFMAAGKAKSVTTIDLSKTYLHIAERNMRRNGFKGSKYRFEQTDVLRWVRDHRHDKQKFGLIFCDPPTFSNSKTTGKQTWDVQRDHARLLIALSRMLTTEGTLIFSTNLRSFTLEEETLERAGVTVKDISAQTIPTDFERARKTHHCFLIKRAITE